MEEHRCAHCRSPSPDSCWSPAWPGRPGPTAVPAVPAARQSPPTTGEHRETGSGASTRPRTTSPGRGGRTTTASTTTTTACCSEPGSGHRPGGDEVAVDHVALGGAVLRVAGED